MLAFAADLGLGIDISGISMISKAARFRVASRSGTLATGLEVFDEAHNSQLALLAVLGPEWRAQWICKVKIFRILSCKTCCKVCLLSYVKAFATCLG